jgi:hypothetical protein
MSPAYSGTRALSITAGLARGALRPATDFYVIASYIDREKASVMIGAA